MTFSEQSLFDMHVHSVRSDGLYSVLQLAQLARRSGLQGIALTDHDAIPDMKQLHAGEELSGVRLLPGIELSTCWQKRGFHLLGYGFDPEDESLRSLCKRLQESRRKRMFLMLEELADKNVHIEDELRNAWNGCASLGRLHLARALVRSGVASTVRMAFRKYLDHLESARFTAAVELPDAVTALHAAGGIAVLAHPPVRLSVDVWRSLIETGIDGLETAHPAHSKCQQLFLQERVVEYDLVATAGSDYHGDDPQRYLGRHTVTASRLSQILERRPTFSCPLSHSDGRGLG